MTDTDSFCIRPATFQDLPEIVLCVRSAYQKYIPSIGRKPAPMVADYAGLIEQGHVHVLVVDNMVCGCLVLIPLSDVLLLDNVAVDPAWQKRGFGKKLLEFSESQARRNRYREIRLYTNERMTENIAWYLRRGFTETHRTVEYGYQRVYMVKTIY